MKSPEIINLPEPDKTTYFSKLLVARRSIRRFDSRPLNTNIVSQLLWSTYGYTTGRRRVVPSAGALYPLEIYASVRSGGVEGLLPGVYQYVPEEHSLRRTVARDVSDELYQACLRQRYVKEAPLNIIVIGVPERITAWYGERGIQYMVLEAGHVGQNIYLASVELGLGTVAIGAFEDALLKRILGLPNEYIPLYVFPVGYPRT
ncbi:SagB/ThcOx family dehydrogenase [Thermogladius sp. 4427co]|uniref:SagB/ThcOx family dehydrogenase n=1 Tax=Thermogladius sp. 4427co TaxID=3450718 RepID=UPI003F79BCE7